MNQICRKPNEIIPFCEEWFAAGLNGFWGTLFPWLVSRPVHIDYPERYSEQYLQKNNVAWWLVGRPATGEKNVENVHKSTNTQKLSSNTVKLTINSV
ncbi:hypothetical protein [Arcicella rosea]|uniref:Uncharacterized protein n=1 Tax=Arcicella rosea TaxID=502909 RepID=A0A841EUG4_9BACT|nr:hypothetical protein [Arcicella rosea]MBB6004703.1 hypothetical protein [Arcicella rosea]